ncbi:acyl carrier protein [Streptomyces sp. NPDC017448]|uniref:acyl carrier protein n=1 Tax=Streptomyces sp. NPDC017448 TaxID=3364996 RepID=UPI0037B5AE2B
MSTDQATTTATTAARTPEEVRAWLTERVAYFLDVTPQDIASDVLLVEIGLDSVYALTLCGDVEERFGIVVEATLAWDHPTVDALTAHIHAQIAGPR